MTFPYIRTFGIGSPLAKFYNLILLPDPCACYLIAIKTAPTIL